MHRDFTEVVLLPENFNPTHLTKDEQMSLRRQKLGMKNMLNIIFDKEQKDFIKRAFHWEQAPPNNKINNILPFGELWAYISSDLLNGFINYVKVEKAFVINRHHGLTEELPKPISILRHVFRTKVEIFDAVTKPNAVHHAKLDSWFQDDVLILAKDKDDEDGVIFIFFWFDRFPGDSCIGRFKLSETDFKTKEAMIESFSQYAVSKSTHKSNEPPQEIPLHYFDNGWLSS
jgi:hypothetical protein